MKEKKEKPVKEKKEKPVKEKKEKASPSKESPQKAAKESPTKAPKPQTRPNKNMSRCRVLLLDGSDYEVDIDVSI